MPDCSLLHVLLAVMKNDRADFIVKTAAQTVLQSLRVVKEDSA